jgi:fructokinase
MFDVVALGELLMDVTHIGQSQQKNDLFEANPGGAPANVVGCLAKLGLKVGFIGKVGNDHFGYRLKDALEGMGVCTKGLVMDQEARTTLAFVHLLANGERAFTFYRGYGADTLLRPDEIDPSMFNTRVVHFGSLSLTDEPARSATLYALHEARKRNVLVSYDPNLRPRLWRGLGEARQAILSVMDQADIVKVSEEELEFLTGIDDVVAGSRRMFSDYNLKMLLVTLGDRGCYFRTAGLEDHVPGFAVSTVDTTGAGDAFLGGILYGILSHRKRLQEWDREDVTAAVRFANAVGALSTTKNGAIPAMPSLEEIHRFLACASGFDEAKVR